MARTFNKMVEENTVFLTIYENDKQIWENAFPSIPAFEINGLVEVEEGLRGLGKDPLTGAEIAQLNAWGATGTES